MARPRRIRFLSLNRLADIADSPNDRKHDSHPFEHLARPIDSKYPESTATLVAARSTPPLIHADFFQGHSRRRGYASLLHALADDPARKG